MIYGVYTPLSAGTITYPFYEKLIWFYLKTMGGYFYDASLLLFGATYYYDLTGGGPLGWLADYYYFFIAIY